MTKPKRPTESPRRVPKPRVDDAETEDDRVSLAPAEFEDAVKALLNTPPAKNDD